MDCLKNEMKSHLYEHLCNTTQKSSYHHVTSSIPPDVKWELVHMQEQNQMLKKENVALEKKVEFLMMSGEQLKATAKDAECS